MKNRYYLLRHGETSYQLKKKKIIYPWPEKTPINLTEKGREQAEKAGKKLKKEDIDLIYSSDLFRACQTAEVVAKELNLPIFFDKRLREINLGIFKGRPMVEFEKFYSTKKEKFFKRPPRGESWNDVKKRMLNFIRGMERKYKNKNILIISHGDPLWLLIGSLRGFSQKDFLEKGKNIYPKVGEILEL